MRLRLINADDWANYYLEELQRLHLPLLGYDKYRESAALDTILAWKEKVNTLKTLLWNIQTQQY